MESRVMEERLLGVFPDARVEVREFSGGGDHFVVAIQTEAFRGLSLLKRHRAVMAVFSEEMASGVIHALSIEAKTPDGS